MKREAKQRQKIGFELPEASELAHESEEQEEQMALSEMEEEFMISNTVRDSSYSYAAGIKDDVKRMQHVLLTQYLEAPLNVKKAMLDDYRTAVITDYLITKINNNPINL